VSYAVKTETVRACGPDLQLRSLLDLQQYSDPEHHAEHAGISEEAWPQFGVLWPSGRVLAHQMAALPFAGERILEVGCGLALASLVLHRRACNVMSSDIHPLVPEFLAHNTALNSLSALPYQHADWASPNPALGRFDVIIGSDVLYARGMGSLLAGFIAAHAEPHARIILVDPNRSQRAGFTRELEAQGFTLTSTVVTEVPGLEGAPYRGRLLEYAR
jgi:predicted nicotinamide N-methyase